MNNVDELIPTRQSLLSRLKNLGDDESWRTFFETYWRLIYNTAIKAGLNDAEAQDTVQETVISVLKAMPEFKYRQNNQSFKSWLLRLTRWRIGDQIRKREKVESLESPKPKDPTLAEVATETTEGLADPASIDLDASWEADWEQNLMDAAVERTKAIVDPKTYQIFDLCVFKEWPVSRVAQALKINPARVYLAKHRVGKLIKKQVKRLQTEPLDGLTIQKD